MTASREDLISRYERRVRLMVPAEVDDLRDLALFKGIPEKARDKVIEKVRKYLHIVDYAEGETVLREGDYGDSAFFLISGSAEVTLRDKGPAPGVRGGAHVPPAQRAGAKPEAESMIGRGSMPSGTVILTAVPALVTPGGTVILKQGEIFGELSALSRYPVSANVRAKGPTRLLQIRLPGLRMLTASSKEFKKFLDERYRSRALGTHLRGVRLFSELEDAMVEQLRQRAELRSFEPGQVIVAEGTAADKLLLVRGGYVKVSVRAGSSDLAVTYLRMGDYAGEAALLLEETWPFTLQALEHVEIVEIAKSQLDEIVAVSPSVQDEMWSGMVERLKARGAAMRHPTSSEYVQMAMETGLIHGESVFLIDLSTCTRCDECVRGCADAHGGEPRFVREGYKYRNWLVPTACYQCTDPVCMMDCPTGAITRAVGTLEVTIDEPTCIGCSNCANRCPWDNIIMVERDEKRPDGKNVEVASKCDLCLTRPEGPACVQMCPHGSAVRISFKDLDKVMATLK